MVLYSGRKKWTFPCQDQSAFHKITNLRKFEYSRIWYIFNISSIANLFI